MPQPNPFMGPVSSPPSSPPRRNGITVHVLNDDMSKLTELFERGFLTVERDLASPTAIPPTNTNIQLRVPDISQWNEPMTLEQSPLGYGQDNEEICSALVTILPCPNGKLKKEVIRLEQLPPGEDVIAKLICWVCGNFPESPLYFCSRGHHVCLPCGQQLQQCPVLDPDTIFPCGTGLNSTECRFIHFLLMNSLIRCPFASYGCTQTQVGRHLEFHKSFCPFRPYVTCPFSHCPIGSTSYTNYFGHVADFHNVQVIESSSSTLRLPFDEGENRAHRFVGAIFKHSGLEFAFCVEADSLYLKLWMSSMNNPDVLEKRIFKSCFRLTSETNIYKLQWQGEIHAREKTSASIMSEGECLVVPTVLLSKKYVFTNGEEEGKFWNIDISVTEVNNDVDVGWNGWEIGVKAATDSPGVSPTPTADDDLDTEAAHNVSLGSPMMLMPSDDDSELSLSSAPTLDWNGHPESE